MGHLNWLAPSAAVVLCLGVSLTPAGGPPSLETVTMNDVPCGPEGTATSAGGKALNRLKNRFTFPKPEDMDSTVSLAAMLAPGADLTRFNSGKAATIRGFVIKVSHGGISHGESCNCKSQKASEVDIHIDIGLTPNAPPRQRVVAEITHRLRLLKGMETPPVDWSKAKIEQEFEGQFVEISGWLMFDTAHVNQAENTNPGNPGNFRATSWELHPVTAIKKVNPPKKPLTPASLNIGPLQEAHAEQVRDDKRALDALRALREDALKGFSAEELKEIEEEAKERQEKK